MARGGLATAIVAALVVASPAGAHVDVTPTAITAGERTSVTLSGPNERDEPMTGFAVTVPAGFEILRAERASRWATRVEEPRVTWTGGPLAPESEASFALELVAESDPGVVRLDVEQTYPSGAVVDWPVELTVLPAKEKPRQNLGWAAVVGVLGLLVVGAVVALTWRRRTRSLQER